MFFSPTELQVAESRDLGPIQIPILTLDPNPQND